jgi:CPA2 family monovalent cation:H+ antiporter-2
MTEQLLAQSLLLILASALAVGFFAASRMPAAIGYLLAGLAIGPYGLNLVAPGDDTRFLAELGLIFLMFMVGLEFSLATLLAARTDVLLAGSLQVAATRWQRSPPRYGGSGSIFDLRFCWGAPRRCHPPPSP